MSPKTPPLPEHSAEPPPASTVPVSSNRTIRWFIAAHLIAIAGITLAAYQLGNAAEQGLLRAPEDGVGPTERVAEIRPAQHAHAADELTSANRLLLRPSEQVGAAPSAPWLPPLGLR